VAYLFCLVLSIILLASFLISFSFTYSQYDNSFELLSPYECGFEPISRSHVLFCMKFFLLAILFIVFDVEVSFLFPTLFCSSVVLSLLLVLLAGVLYEFRYGGLDWVQ